MGKEPNPPVPPGDDAGDADRDLVARAVGGDERAFEVLIRRKREKVFWIAFRIVGNEQDALEIAQTTFVRLWKVIDRYRPEQSFDTWLHRITVNLAIDYYRSRGPARDALPIDEIPEGRLEPAARERGSIDPLETLAGAELQKIFNALAARLGERQRAIFVLSQIEGVPTDEIARVMGISESTVRNHLLQARRSLQEGLRRFYPEYYLRGAPGKTEPPERS